MPANERPEGAGTLGGKLQCGAMAAGLMLS